MKSVKYLKKHILRPLLVGKELNIVNNQHINHHLVELKKIVCRFILHTVHILLKKLLCTYV